MKGLNPLRLMVVEDDAIIARAVQRTLAKRGHEVVVASSCGAARALNGGFDCAVLDVHLPDGNGVDLARDIAGRAARVVVFFSGSSDENTRLKASTFGRFVTKSSGIDALERAIADAVSEIH